ncbi:cubilin-like [Actinia tenebrosa]|uniref:Cubilin-like n=1 Tax=Actinia tenebrosa TaxID=6105 RepID=A0A6P8HBN2_ACTTE|nr:cubilin-like [Actinia tenebrosa]
MRVNYPSIYALACALVFLLYSKVRGADVCGSDKSVENQVVLSKSIGNNGNITLFEEEELLPRMTCAWQITAPPGYSVVLKVDCPGEAVERSETLVFDGNSSSDVLLWNSSKTYPPFDPFTLFSSGESMRVVLKTMNTSESSPMLYKYVAVVYAVQTAPDYTNNHVVSLRASSTVAKFTSPYYPIAYPLNVSCVWRIQAPRGKFVRLQFGRPLVEYKHLQVYDGEESIENLLWEYVSGWLFLRPYVIFSYTQPLLIKFKSGSIPRSNGFKGFEMEYTAVEPGCTASNPGVGFNASFGSISTPGFPSDVPTRAMTCVWSLKAPVGHVIKLDLDTINLLPDKVHVCSGLYIKYLPVYEFTRFDYVLTCSVYESRTFVSSGRKMQIVYTQPAYVGRRSVGVIAKYAAIPLVTTGSCDANQPGTINLHGEAATFHSLSYPKHHPGNMNCMWNITVTGGQVIELLIYTNFGSDCDKEYIQIYDGATKSSPLIKKVCGVSARKLYSSRNHLFVEFIGESPSQGFIGTFVARKAAPKPYACSSREFYFNQTQGMLASRRFPLSYPNNVICEWYITVPSEYIVNFTVLFLDLQPDPSCSKDYLLLSEVVEGFRDGKEIAKICGTNISQVSYQSTSKKMIVEFRSDAIGMYPGFEAKFEAVYKPPKHTSKASSKVSTVTIVLIAVFSVVGVIGLAILIVWIVKYRYHCCADQSRGKFDMMKMDDTDDVKM